MNCDAGTREDNMDSTVASGKSFGAIKDFAVLALGNARILARKNPYAPATMMGLKGDGPGRCERGDRGHDRDRAFR